MSEGVKRISCLNDLDHFCYFNGEYIVKEDRRNKTDLVPKYYSDYFKIPINLDMTWVPHACCKMYAEHLRQWSNRARTKLKFGKPMIWREPKITMMTVTSVVWI